MPTPHCPSRTTHSMWSLTQVSRLLVLEVWSSGWALVEGSKLGPRWVGWVGGPAHRWNASLMYCGVSAAVQKEPSQEQPAQHCSRLCNRCLCVPWRSQRMHGLALSPPIPPIMQATQAPVFAWVPPPMPSQFTHWWESMLGPRFVSNTPATDNCDIITPPAQRSQRGLSHPAAGGVCRDAARAQAGRAGGNVLLQPLLPHQG